METLKIPAILLFILMAMACNNQQSKKSEQNISTVKKSLPEKIINKKINNSEIKKGKECESLVKEILKSSPRYKELTKGLEKAVIKNGGQSFGISLEGSPIPQQDNTWIYSKTYDYSIYEAYTDRQLNIARFSFDPNTKQLFEYDVNLDKLKLIEFDRSLLLKFEALSK